MSNLPQPTDGVSVSEQSLSEHAGSPVRHTRLASRSRQRGMSMTGVMAIISVSLFLGLFAFKVGPHYFENWTVAKIADDAAGNGDLMKSKSRSKIYNYLNQAYRTNSLWDLTAEDTVKLKKDGKRGWTVHVQYEKRANLFSNIDVVTRFDKVAGLTD